MAITSDSNLTIQVNQLGYTLVLDNSGENGGPYYIRVLFDVPESVTDPTFFDAAISSFASSIETLLPGLTLTSTIQKRYSGGDLPENSVTSNNVTV
jgi:hypothetical protein